jgi:hypothetical protein
MALIIHLFLFLATHFERLSVPYEHGERRFYVLEEWLACMGWSEELLSHATPFCTYTC